jgi:hypothetical protein
VFRYFRVFRDRSCCSQLSCLPSAAGHLNLSLSRSAWKLVREQQAEICNCVPPVVASAPVHCPKFLNIGGSIQRSFLMRFRTARILALFCLMVVLASASFAQSAHRKRYPKTKPNADEQKRPAPKSEAAKQAQKPEEKAQEKEEPLDVAPDPEAIKIGTEVVSVPVVVSDRNDIYVPDLRQEEFTLYEDGIKQEIVFFSTVKEPFNVVLMLDTSGSTQEKLRQIQSAAKEFVAQLQPQDRIRVVSFDDQINDLTEFTNDRAALRTAIDRTQPGKGTKLYDALKYVLNLLTRVKGRKAIVLFSDGVDSYSDSTHYDDNIAQLEEAGVIVYPIRYNTRRETEAMVREQAERGTIGNQTPPPTSPRTGGGYPVPTDRQGKNDPYKLPVPPIALPMPSPRGRYPDGRAPDSRYPDSRYPDDRYPDSRYPGGGRYPDSRYPDSRYPDSRYPEDRLPDARSPYPPSSRRGGDDSISMMLDGLYATAARYMSELASTSGGSLHYADDLSRLPDTFAKIADELRNQYSLGYYPANPARDGQFRKIQVKVSRKNVVVRARPGYRAPR